MEESSEEILSYISQERRGDFEMLRLTLNFIDGLPNRVQRLEEARDSKNWEELTMAAHSLCSAGLFGIPTLHTRAKDLHEAAQQQIEGIVRDVIYDIKKHCEMLQELKSKYNPDF